MWAETEVKEVVSNVVELDSENYGAPPENSGIAAYKKGMDSPISSISEPQAWEDDHGNWFYNFAGALQLGKFLWRTLPNFDQFVATIKANPDNFSKSTGTRNWENGSFYGYDKLADFWTSVEDGANDAYFASFSLDNYNRIDVGGRGERDRNDGLFVRFIVDKK